MKKCMKLTIFTIFIFLFSFLNVSAEENVELVSVKLQEKSEYVEINEEVSLDGNKIISNVNFFDEGDYVIYKFVIKNNDDRDYKISDIFDDNESEYLDFQYTYDEFIGAKEEKEVLLKITYKSQLPYDAVLTPENEFNAVNEISVSIELEEVVINPSTFDNISLYLILEIVGVVALLVIFIKLKKKNAVLLLILAIILIPKNTNAKIDFKINFTFKNTMNLKVNYLDQNWRSNVSGTYKKIEFIKTNNFPDDAIDVSQEQDGTIKYWIEDETIYIGSRYIIFFPNNSKNLFIGLSSAQNINFNDRIDTTFVTNMDSMFLGCSGLKEIDLSSFRTGNVTNMAHMFQYNVLIESIDVSNFDTSKVTDMSYFLSTCQKLKIAILDNISLPNGNLNYFLQNANELKEISIKNAKINFTGSANLNSYFTGSYDNSLPVEKIDVTGWDLSNATSLQELFYNFRYLKEIKGLDTWDTSTIINMFRMFYNVGYCAETIDIGSISNWDISNVERISDMFYGFGFTSKEINLSISNWKNDKISQIDSIFQNFGYAAQKVNLNLKDIEFSNASQSVNMFYQCGFTSEELNLTIDNLKINGASRIDTMFSMLGYAAKKINFNLKDIEFLNLSRSIYMFHQCGYNSNEFNFVIDNLKITNNSSLDSMFYQFGDKAKELNVNMSNVEISGITSISSIFSYIGEYSENAIINLSNWLFSDLTSTYQLFYYAGNHAENFELNLSNWNMPNVTNMTGLFYSVGSYANNFKINLEDINIPKVNNVSSMFQYAGASAKNMVIKGLDKIDFSRVSDSSSLISYVGYSNSQNSEMFDFGTINIYSSNIRFLLSYTPKIKLVINLYENPTNYYDAFKNAATSEGSEIIVNYTANVTNIDDIIATKSENSNVVKGELIEE